MSRLLHRWLVAAFALLTTGRVPRPKYFVIPPEIQARIDATMSRNRAAYGGYTMHGGTAVIERLQKERAACFEFIDRVNEEVEKSDPKRDLSTTERANLDAQLKRVAEIDEQLKPLQEFEELRDKNAQTASRYEPTGPVDDDPEGGEQRGLGGARTNDREYKYRSAGEFLADVWKSGSRSQKVERSQVEASAERLRSTGFLVEGGQLVRAAAPKNTTVEIPGVMPVTILGEIMSDVDAARPFISSIGARDLGSIPGKQFERPTITQHVTAGKQDNELDELDNRQFKIGGVPFTKDVFGGFVEVSRQSIDWSSPAMWDALLTDFIEQYGLTTENAAADAFAVAVVQEVELTDSTSIEDAELKELLKALYGAAKLAYQGSGRLPDTIWASLDWWEVLGVIIDHLKATTAGDGGGDSDPKSFAGNLLRTPRIIVPSFPDGTLIVGVKSRTEVYEERYGFLSQVQPKVLGVDLAYGGEMASGTVKPAAFAKVVPATP